MITEYLSFVRTFGGEKHKYLWDRERDRLDEKEKKKILWSTWPEGPETNKTSNDEIHRQVEKDKEKKEKEKD